MIRYSGTKTSMRASTEILQNIISDFVESSLYVRPILWCNWKESFNLPISKYGFEYELMYELLCFISRDNLNIVMITIQPLNNTIFQFPYARIHKSVSIYTSDAWFSLTLFTYLFCKIMRRRTTYYTRSSFDHFWILRRGRYTLIW